MEKNVEPKIESRKVLHIVISILVSIILWFYIDVELSPDVTKTFNDIPVEFINEETMLADNGLMLLSGYDATVDVKLKAPRKEMRKLDKDNIRIVADTGTITSTGVKALRWTLYYPDNVSSNKVSIASSSAYTVTVTVGELYTKEVPIVCEVKGTVASGYFTGELQVDPETLVLRAERENLLNVKYAKVVVNLSEAKSTIIETLEYQLYDYNDVPIQNDAIRSNIKLIQVTLPVRTKKTVPLTVDLVGIGNTTDTIQYEINPKDVTLVGESETLDGIDRIVLDKIYIEDLVEYQTYNYSIKAPVGTYIYGHTTEASVIVTVNGAIEKEITIFDVTPVNLAEGLKAKIVDSLDVTVWGVSSEIALVGPVNIIASADMSSITEPGVYTLPVQISILGYDYVSVKGIYEIEVVVKDRNEIEEDEEVEDPDAVEDGETETENKDDKPVEDTATEKDAAESKNDKTNQQQNNGVKNDTNSNR